MATGAALIPKPLDHQIPVLLSDARFKILACGRRWGKTGTGIPAAIKGHGPTPGHFKGVIDGGTIWWVAPTYKTIANSKIWEQLKRSLKGVWEHKSEVDREIILPNGGSIAVRSADDPDSLRGPGLDGVILDEVAFMKSKAWEEGIRPALSDKQGWAMMLTTPNGKNWFHKLFQEACRRDSWERWNRPSTDNPLVTEAEMEEVKRELGPIKFAQEHLAQFTEIEGALFQSHCFDDHIWADRWPEIFETGAIAVDPSLGRTENSDFAGITFVGVSGGLLWVDCLLVRKAPELIVRHTLDLHDRYRPDYVGIEANGFQSVLANVFDLTCQLENRAPLPLVQLTNSNAKVERVARLDPYLSNHQIRFRQLSRHTEEMIEQLQMFPNREFHDDGPDSLEMAIRLLQMAQNVPSDDYESEYVEL